MYAIYNLEICGDGIHEGQLDCDDGNLIDGDGCSSQCKIEDGYKCEISKQGGPDICTDNLPPEAIIILKTNFLLEIRFTEEIRILQAGKKKMQLKSIYLIKLSETGYQA